MDAVDTVKVTAVSAVIVTVSVAAVAVMVVGVTPAHLQAAKYWPQSPQTPEA